MYVRRGSAVLRDTVVALLAPLSDLQVDVVVPEGAKNIITVGDTVDIMWEDEKSKGIVVSVHDKGVTVHFGNEDLPPVVGTRVSVRIYTTLKRAHCLCLSRSSRKKMVQRTYIRKMAEKKKKLLFLPVWSGTAAEMLSREFLKEMFGKTVRRVCVAWDQGTWYYRKKSQSNYISKHMSAIIKKHAGWSRRVRKKHARRSRAW